MSWVATGRLWPSEPGTKVHTVPLETGFVKVSVDNVHRMFITMPLPKETMGATTLGESKGSMVMWPENWIELMDEKVFIIVLNKCSVNLILLSFESLAFKPLASNFAVCRKIKFLPINVLHFEMLSSPTKMCKP